MAARLRHLLPQNFRCRTLEPCFPTAHPDGAAVELRNMAEAGVFLGGTAMVMLAASPEKRLHLFDTFEGFPHGEGDFEAGSISDVKRNLIEYKDRLESHAGLYSFLQAPPDWNTFDFPASIWTWICTTARWQPSKWFWPRMVHGGILLSHDYPLSDSVVKAFHEFFAMQPEPFITLSGNQCLAVKS